MTVVPLRHTPEPRDRPALYVPIEVKYRELESQLLLAIAAANHGWRTYIGTKGRIWSLVRSKSSKGGVFLYKGSLPAQELHWIHERCDVVAVLDQEMSPNIIDIARAIPGRFYAGSAPLIDRYYVVGRRAYEAAQEHLPDLGGDIVLSGWPRIDLWHGRGSALHNTQGVDLKARVGSDYVLFVSDFGITSPRMLASQVESFAMDRFPVHDVETQVGRAANTYYDYLKTIAALRAWDEDPAVPPVIVRPHPADDHRGWRDDLKGMNKTSVVFEGDVGPWIMAAEAVVHRGCTTAIQAHMAGKRVYHLAEASSGHTPWLPYLLSDANVGRGAPPCGSAVRPLPASDHAKGRELLSQSIHTPPQGAAQVIADDLADLDVTPEPAWEPSRLQWARAHGVPRWLGSTMATVRRRRQAHSVVAPPAQKMPGGIQWEDLRPALSLFGDGAVTVRRVLPDLWEVGPRTVTSDTPVRTAHAVLGQSQP